ncbi:MAG: DUF4913 domain-containing protein, partial [Solirubrobacteraceae bacterium]
GLRRWDPPSGGPAAFGGGEATAALRDAVTSVLRRRLEAVAAQAVDTLLDESALEQLRASADNAARVALHEAAAAPDAGDQPPELYFPTVLAFVTDHLTPMYRRSVSGTDRTWCAEWWRHAEAVSRLEALWRSWEYLRLDGNLGISVWMRDHLDHHMAVLLDADGPFKGCKPDQHAQRVEAFPLEPPIPPDLFDVH